MLRTLLTQAASRFDRAATAAVMASTRRARARNAAERLSHDERMAWLGRLEQAYNRPEYFDDPDTFFAPGEVREARSAPVRAFHGGEVIDLSWRSACAPLGDDVRERYLACAENQTAHARLFTHGDRGRPAVILVHGYLGGRWAIEERSWPVGWLFDRGLDVALALLPFHGLRGDPQRAGPPVFPGADARITVEGFRQAVIDLRALVTLLEARGAARVGVMGMSLGGYSTALFATVERRLAFAVPTIPLASLADFGRDTGRLVGTPEQQAQQHAALEASMRVVSPFGRPAVLPSDRIMIVAGEGDRITPLAHARRLAQHFDAPLEVFHGGHLLQFGRADAFRSVWKMLGRLGVLERR